MGRHLALRDVNQQTGEVTLALYDEEKARKTISNAHRLALRTAEALRKLVLFEPELVEGEAPTSAHTVRKTEIGDFAQGQVDPAVIMVLKARDSYLSEEKDYARLGFFKEMRTLLQEVREANADLVRSMTAAVERQRDREQAERHHKDKIELLREKGNKDKGGSTLRDLMDRALEGVVDSKVEEAIDRLAPIVVEEEPEVAGDDPSGEAHA